MRIEFEGAGHVDATQYDAVSPRAVTRADARVFDYVNGEAGRTRMEGTGLVYGNGDEAPPTAGTIEEIVLYEGADGVLARIEGEFDAGGGLFASRDAFWEAVLRGPTELDFTAAPESGRFLARTSLAGDAMDVEEGMPSRGADDTARLGTAKVTFAGDASRLLTDTGSYEAGDDVVEGGIHPDGEVVVVGDVGQMFQGTTLAAGDDRITIQGAGSVYGDVWRMVFGGATLEAGDDRIFVGGAEGQVSVAWGDADELSDTNLGPIRIRAGDDRITAGDGPVRMVGDVRYIGLSRDGTLQEMGDDRLKGGDGDDVIAGDVQFFGSFKPIVMGDDDIRGGGGDDVIHGDAAEVYGLTSDAFFSGGNDKIRDGSGDDEVYAGVGDDLVIAGSGRDLYDGGAGEDRLTYRGSREGVRIDLAEGTVSGGDAEGDTIVGFERIEGSKRAGDRILGTRDDDRLDGRGGDDRLKGRGGDDRLDGGSGDDRLSGGGGRDDLRGGTGDDRLNGGSGRDRIEGGEGADRLKGGGRADEFVFGAGSGEDVVRDFERGLDVLALGWAVDGFDDLDLDSTEDGVRVSFGADSVSVEGVTTLGAGDFLFE